MHQLERRWRRVYDPDAKLVFKVGFGVYKTALMATKAAFYEICISGASNLQKETFKVLKELNQVKEKGHAASLEECNKLQA